VTKETDFYKIFFIQEEGKKIREGSLRRKVDRKTENGGVRKRK